MWQLLTYIYLSCICLSGGCLPMKHKPIRTNVDNKLVVGAENIAAYLPLLKGKKVACVVNQSSMVKNTHLIDTLLALKIHVNKIMAPEHGFRGIADAGEKVNNEYDTKTGLPIISLYGKNKKPTATDLQDIDVVVFDLQDVGVRFFTYISTLHLVMEACSENNLPIIVLDRPNPHAHYVDGPVLKADFVSFVGMHQVPLVYGMTIGEYAQMINGEYLQKKKCLLTVIPCLDYKRAVRYSLPLPPSPNLPNAVAVQLYPSLCLFEGSVMSIGRGTKKQFQLIGHPSVDAQFSFVPKPNLGAKDPLFNGQTCYGVDLSNEAIDDLFAAKKINLNYLMTYYNEFNSKKQKFFLDNFFFDKLAGNDQLRHQIMEGKSESEIRAGWQKDINAFLIIRKKYLLYAD